MRRRTTALNSRTASVALRDNKPIIERLLVDDWDSGIEGGGTDPVVELYDPIACRLYRSDTDETLLSSSLQFSGEATATYRVEAGLPNAPSVSFDVGFSLSFDTLTISVANVHETANVQLVSVTLGSLISVSSDNRNSRLLIPTHGGRIVDPSAAGFGERYHPYNWVQDSFCQVGAVYNGSLIAVLTVLSVDDQMHSFVGRSDGVKVAGLGVCFTHRYTCADPAYRHRGRRRSARGTRTTEGSHAENSFIAHDESAVTIVLSKQKYPQSSKGWIGAAEIIRERLPKKKCRRYKDRFVSKLYIGDPGSDELMTFADALALIRRFHARTGGAGHIAYLVGFQHDGHDTGYPDVFTANARAGGHEELVKLITEARHYGATVSFHDNFDDAYRSSPKWDPTDIAIDNTGNLLRGGIWNEEQAYWISMPAYAERKVPARIEETLKLYPISDTYHLDVLTASVFRIDFRRGTSHGRERDLAARLNIVRQFAERGIDVSSEACGLPFIGPITFFWHLVRVPREVYRGDRRVPFTAFVAHGRADYGEGVADKNGLLDSLLYGSFWTEDIRKSSSFQATLDAYFLVFCPMNALRDEEMVDYQESGTRKRVIYQSGSYVEVDFESQEYCVVINGMVMVEDDVAIVPAADGDGWILYKASQAPFAHNSRTVPESWRSRESITVVPLLDAGEGDEVVLPIDCDRMELDIDVGIAYRCRF